MVNSPCPMKYTITADDYSINSIGRKCKAPPTCFTQWNPDLVNMTTSTGIFKKTAAGKTIIMAC